MKATTLTAEAPAPAWLILAEQIAAGDMSGLPAIEHDHPLYSDDDWTLAAQDALADDPRDLLLMLKREKAFGEFVDWRRAPGREDVPFDDDWIA